MLKKNVERDLLDSFLYESVTAAAKSFMSHPNEYGDRELGSYMGYSKALQVASERTGRMVTFYKNGEQFERGVRVSLILGKTFRNFDLLCDYLTNKTQIPYGVRYIFTLEGNPVHELHQLQHNCSYVVSGVKQFQQLPYGQQDILRKPHVTVGTLVNGIKREDLKLLRPLSPQTKFNIYDKFPLKAPGRALTFGHDGKIVTVINSKEPERSSRVLLNLRNPSTFEVVLRDLGQAVQLPNAKKMFTEKGREVRSISQLRRELTNTELLYVEGASRKANGVSKAGSQSLESVHMSHANGLRRGHRPANGFEPDASIKRVDSAPDVLDSPFNHTAVNNVAGHEWGPLSEPMSSRAPATDTGSALSLNTMETQTSPEFTLQSRQLAKKARKKRAAKQKSPERAATKASSTTYSREHPPDTQSVAIGHHIQQVNSNFSPPHHSRQDIAGASMEKELKRDYVDASWEEGISLEDTPNLQSQIRQAYGIANGGGMDWDAEEARLASRIRSPEQTIIDGIANAQRSMQTRSSKADRTRERNHKNQAQVSEAPIKAQVAPIESEMPNPAKNAVSTDENKNEINGNNLKSGINPPDKNFYLKRVLGYLGDSVGNNLAMINREELVYYVAAIAVIWNPKTNAQRFYTEHTEDIECLAVHSQSGLVATAQKAREGPGKLPPFQASIKVWNSEKCQTFGSLEDAELGKSVLALSFSHQGFLLILTCSDSEAKIYLWDWREDHVISSINHSLEKDELTFGAVFHPSEEDIIVTFGQQHLNLWQLTSDRSGFERRSPLRVGAKVKGTINVLAFLDDESLLTGDATGTLMVWAPSQGDDASVQFIQTEFKGHQKPITALHVMPNTHSTVISGDVEGNVKTWHVHDGDFRLLNTVKVPSSCGAICSIASLAQDQEEVFIGSSMNQILYGSAIHATSFTFAVEGHALGVRSIAPHPHEMSFFSGALDHKVCKWTEDGLVWRKQLSARPMSLASHPSGQVVAIGGTDGIVHVLTSNEGLLVSQLPISKSIIGSLAYSPDGDVLAAGTHDGTMYLLPVSENGFSYEKISILKGPHSVLSLQWSNDSQYILTSVNDNQFQELILWDLGNCRYMRGIASTSQSIDWKDATCSGGEDVRGIWDNDHMTDVVNLACHCSPNKKYLVAGDEQGSLRLFSYPCPDRKSAFFVRKVGSSGVSEVKFLADEAHVVTANFEGVLMIWELDSHRHDGDFS